MKYGINPFAEQFDGDDNQEGCRKRAPQTEEAPDRRRQVALVDGNKKQLRLLKEQAKAFAVTLTIIIDFIHVLEYLWKASRVFFQEGDPRCEQFVSERLLLVLLGQSSQVANEIRNYSAFRSPYTRRNRLSFPQ